MGPYNTPGVYIEEISKFPPSVAQVETAIPAFIGYTERAELNGRNLTNVPTRIRSLIDYESIFGGPFMETFTGITLKNDADLTATPPELPINAIDVGPVEPTLVFRMYYALRMYFDNGGGPCYIISVAQYPATGAGAIDADLLKQGLDPLKKEDEPTLILFPDAVALTGDNSADVKAAYYDLYVQALNQCNELQDRFTIIDIFGGDQDSGAPGSTVIDNDFRNGIGGNNLKYGAAYYPWLETTIDYVYDESTMVIANYTTTTSDTPPATGPEIEVQLRNDGNEDTSLYHLNNALYHQVKNAIAEFNVVMPPGAAMAGIYAAVDSSRGVWKAPANVGVRDVIRPTVIVNDEAQASLNVHPSGKSVNVIRDFVGRGILVWGARTLAGNDNEWRYVSVRRFFNMAEESIKKATEQFVFEPNDANTWAKVRGMIENFLTIQWRNGALAGAKPEDAFFVRVGLPDTMNSQDILEGRMNVEIGMAVVRPAEFIILKFSHKMQES